MALEDKVQAGTIGLSLSVEYPYLTKKSPICYKLNPSIKVINIGRSPSEGEGIRTILTETGTLADRAASKLQVQITIMSDVIYASPTGDQKNEENYVSVNGRRIEKVEAIQFGDRIGVMGHIITLNAPYGCATHASMYQ